MQERDESVQRVLWVDLLNLLALEGAAGERVRATLDASGATTKRSSRGNALWARVSSKCALHMSLCS